MINAIFFDLDGTLLPMDQERFIESYLRRMAIHMAPHGYDPKLLTKAIWAGTGAMVQNDTEETNEEIFWRVFSRIMGRDVRRDEPLFNRFYETDFQEVRQDCGFDPRTSQVIRGIKALGYRTVLATNPLFPAIATQSRARWAGLQPEDFEHITTYENSTRCKPSLDYYREILGKLELTPAECMMVGNDVSEDMIARELGFSVFLLTPCLINKHNEDISQFPQGDLDDLMDFIRSLA